MEKILESISDLSGTFQSPEVIIPNGYPAFPSMGRGRDRLVPNAVNTHLNHSLDELQGKYQRSVLVDIERYTRGFGLTFSGVAAQISERYLIKGDSLSKIYRDIGFPVSEPTFRKIVATLGIRRDQSLLAQSSMPDGLHGLTGTFGRDGILTAEQQTILDKLQNETADKCMESLNSLKPGDKFPLAAMATGIGKGRIIHEVIRRQKEFKPDSKVLVIAGTKNVLVVQTQKSLTGYQEEYVDAEDLDIETVDVSEPLEEKEELKGYSVGRFGDFDKDVQVATIQTITSANARAILDHTRYDLVVVDEVHNIGTSKRFAAIKDFKKVVGFTATPYRHSGKLKSPEEYGFNIVQSLTLPEAQIDLRLLPPLCGIQLDTKGLVADVPISPSGVIEFKELEGVLKDSLRLRPFIVDRVSDLICADGKNYKTVVAVNFVWEAQELAQLFRDKGIKVGIAVNQKKAKEIHTESTPSVDAIDRYILPESNPKSVQVLISPYVASEGFDAPFTEVLVWASPTNSSVRYTQYTGRLARRAPGKAYGVIVDCLYQTSQYGWSYNMGMWMKDSVRQTENGLLWLGPEQDISLLSILPAMEAMRSKADIRSLSSLQNTGILAVQPDDFPITNEQILQTFKGKARPTVKVAREVLEEIKKEHPELIEVRRSGTRDVQVCTDKGFYIRKVAEAGVSLKTIDMETLDKDDYPISLNYLKKIFRGGSSVLRSLIEETRNVLGESNPDIFVKKRSGSVVVEVCTNPDLFNQEMIKLGAEVKEREVVGIEPTDISLHGKALASLFFGKGSDLLNIAMEIVEEENISVSRRKTINGFVSIVDQPDKLLQAMKKKGVRLKEKVGGPLPGDFILSKSSYQSTFIGEYKKVTPIAKEVIDMLKDKNPELFKTCLHGKQYVEVIQDPQLFFTEMLKRGIKLRETES